MGKMQFKSESKRVLDLMINSIYMNKEIFLRELISNASDAIDKLYYKSLSDDNLNFNKEDFYISVEIDKDNRLLKIKDTGIGMNKQDLEDNLGIIAKSGSLKFKEHEDIKHNEDIDIIGQFGVGFYSAFMVADRVEVTSRAHGEKETYMWESDGSDGYIISESDRDVEGTEIVLRIKENTDSNDYDQYLNEETIASIIKKHSDYIRYPIKMELTEKIYKDDGELEIKKEIKTINSMVPIWRKNKNELTDDDYENFYKEKNFGYDKPLKHIHFAVDGHMSYKALMYIPREAMYDYYTSDYEKGLELYSSGVLIKEKTSELLPDYFSFVKGVVDSEDLSLNISREMLQNDRQLHLMAKRIETKIKEELLDLLQNNREEYELFYKEFGKQLKYGVYSDFGMNKDNLKDLLLFYSSKGLLYVTLEEYCNNMQSDQEYIYYATGKDLDKINKLPQVEGLKSKDIEILYLNEEIDEFAIKILESYNEKKFKSVSDSEINLTEAEEKEKKEVKKENKDLFEKMSEYLKDEVIEIEPSNRLKDNPVCLTSKGEVSIEMEKVLNAIPESNGIKADKVLEININHKVFTRLQESYNKKDYETLELYTEILYDQARLIEGLEVEDPIRFAQNISRLM